MLTVATDLCVGLDGPTWGWTALPEVGRPSLRWWSSAVLVHPLLQNQQESSSVYNTVLLFEWNTVVRETQKQAPESETELCTSLIHSTCTNTNCRCRHTVCKHGMSSALWLSQRTKMSRWLNSCHHYTSIPVSQLRGRRVCPLVIVQTHVAHTIIIMTHLHRNWILQGPQLPLPDVYVACAVRMSPSLGL